MPSVHNPHKKRRELHARQNGRCAICDRGLSLSAQGAMSATFDHIIPKSHGGTAALSNLRLVHKVCNHMRGNEIETVSVEIDGYRVLRHQHAR